MIKYLIPFIAVLFVACKQHTETITVQDTVSGNFTEPEAGPVPEIRAKINEEPVAVYSEKIPDELNKWVFSVSLYETKKTFQYLVRIQAKEVRTSDSIMIPNFGLAPKPAIYPAQEKQACIIGFFNKKGEFMEYRKVSFENDRLHISTLQHYAVSSYKTKQP